MSQCTQKKLTAKVLEKAIKASIKKEVSARGINVTIRQGNKELNFLTNKIARYSFDNLEQAQVAGEKLGQHLSELFQHRNKQNLDGGLIQQVTFQKDIWSLAGLSAAESHPLETADDQEDSSSIPAVQIAEDINQTIEAATSAETEEISTTDAAILETVDNQEDSSSIPAVPTTEDINQTIEVTTSAETEEISTTDAAVPETVDNQEDSRPIPAVPIAEDINQTIEAATSAETEEIW